MRREHWHWLARNLDAVNAAFETDFSLRTAKGREHAEQCLDIYDSEDAFNDDFEGVYLRRECAFEILSGEGYAAQIDGKYIYFAELNY